MEGYQTPGGRTPTLLRTVVICNPRNIRKRVISLSRGSVLLK